MRGTKQNTDPIQISFEIPSDMFQGYQKKKEIIHLKLMQIPKLSAVNHVALFVADQHKAQINKKMHV